MSERRRALVLDTSAFIGGFDPASVDEEVYTVPEVGSELISESTSKLRFMISIDSGRLKVLSPEPKYIDLVKSISERIGDLTTLSETDIQVLALAAQLRDHEYDAIIITDDYSIQNTAEKIGLKYASLGNLGIRYQFYWVIRCPVCNKRYPPDRKDMICDNCGAYLERRPRKKVPVKRKFHSAAKAS